MVYLLLPFTLTAYSLTVQFIHRRTSSYESLNNSYSYIYKYGEYVKQSIQIHSKNEKHLFQINLLFLIFWILYFPSSNLILYWKYIVINVTYQWSYVPRCSDDRINSTFFFHSKNDCCCCCCFPIFFFCFLFVLEWFCIIFCICLYKIICIKSISVRKTMRNENILELNLLTWEGWSERESCRAIER